MPEKIEPCECVEVAIHIIRNIDDARRIFRLSPGRAVLHADFAAEEIPKLEECLNLDLSSARERLKKTRELIAQREQAKLQLDLAWSSLMRTIRKCERK